MTIKELMSIKQNSQLTQECASLFVQGVQQGKYTTKQLVEFIKFCNASQFSNQEVYFLAKAMADGGQLLCANDKLGFCVDEYSFSNVPDGMSLVLMSLLASQGFRCIKCVDELGDSSSELFDAIKTKPFQSAAQLDSKETSLVHLFAGKNKLAPAADILYNECDAAGIFCLPIVAACILAKKIAIGATIVLVDAKSGEGSQFKLNQEQVYQMTTTLVEAGKLAGLKIIAVVTDFNWPISASVGTLPLIGEIWDTLSGNKEYIASHLLLLTKEVATCALLASNLVSSRTQAGVMIENVLNNGQAFDRLNKISQQYQLNVQVQSRHERFVDTAVSYITADTSGYLQDIRLGKLEQLANQIVGNGKNLDDAAGVVLMCAEGDKVEQGDKLAQVFYSHNNSRYFKLAAGLYDCFKISKTRPNINNLFYKVVI